MNFDPFRFLAGAAVGWIVAHIVWWLLCAAFFYWLFFW